MTTFFQPTSPRRHNARQDETQGNDAKHQRRLQNVEVCKRPTRLSKAQPGQAGERLLLQQRRLPSFVPVECLSLPRPERVRILQALLMHCCVPLHGINVSMLGYISRRGIQRRQRHCKHSSGPSLLSVHAQVPSTLTNGEERWVRYINRLKIKWCQLSSSAISQL